MKLSEAIRLGAMLKPQAFGWYRNEDGTCAMGAAMDAVNDKSAVVSRRAHERWPVLIVARAECPACGEVLVTDGYTYAGGAMIVHLNDTHRWTREQIADWVETIEAQQPEHTEAVCDSFTTSRSGA